MAVVVAVGVAVVVAVGVVVVVAVGVAVVVVVVVAVAVVVGIKVKTKEIDMFFVTRNEYKRLAARVAKLERKKTKVLGLYSNRTIAAKEIMSNGEEFNNVKLMKALNKVGWKFSMTKKGTSLYGIEEMLV